MSLGYRGALISQLLDPVRSTKGHGDRAAVHVSWASSKGAWIEYCAPVRQNERQSSRIQTAGLGNRYGVP